MVNASKPRLKVLFLTAWYPYPGDSMFGLFVQKHALAVAQNCDVMVLHVCQNADYTDKYTITENCKNRLNEVVVYYKKVNYGILSHPLNIFRWVMAYRKGWFMIRKKWGLPDIVHANILTRTPLIALYLKWRYKIPYIITEHWSRYLDANNSYRGVIRNWVTKMLIRKAGSLSVVSDKLGQAIVSRDLTQKYTVIPNVIDTNTFRINLNKADNNPKIIVHVSCFEECSKNMSGLLKAIKMLSKRRSDFVLKMIGTGKDFHTTVSLARSMDIIGTFVVFEGLLEESKLAEVVADADLMVLPSHYETFGIVVFEGLACGVPVLVSNVADFDNLVKAEYGRILPDTKPETIANHIDKMLNELPKYNSARLRRLVVDRYSPEKVSMDIMGLYNKCLYPANYTIQP